MHYAVQGNASDLHGWPALAPDLHGFGDSYKPETGFAIPDLASDVVALIDVAWPVPVLVDGHLAWLNHFRRLPVRCDKRGRHPRSIPFARVLADLLAVHAKGLDDGLSM